MTSIRIQKTLPVLLLVAFIIALLTKLLKIPVKLLIKVNVVDFGYAFICCSCFICPTIQHQPAWTFWNLSRIFPVCNQLFSVVCYSTNHKVKEDDECGYDSKWYLHMNPAPKKVCQNCHHNGSNIPTLKNIYQWINVQYAMVDMFNYAINLNSRLHWWSLFCS